MSGKTQWFNSDIRNTSASDTMDTLILTEKSNHLLASFTSSDTNVPDTHMACVMTAGTRPVLGSPVILPTIYTGIQRGIHHCSPAGSDHVASVWASNHSSNTFEVYLTRHEVFETSEIIRDYGVRQISVAGGYNIHPRIVYCPESGTQGLYLVTWINVLNSRSSIKGQFYNVADLTEASLVFDVTNLNANEVIDSGYNANSTDLNKSLTHSMTLTYYGGGVYATYKQNANALNVKFISLPTRGRVTVEQYTTYGANGIGCFDMALKDHPNTPELMIVYTAPNQNQGVMVFGNTIRLFPSSMSLPSPRTLSSQFNVRQPCIVEAFRTSDGKKTNDPTKILDYEYIVAWNRTAGGISYGRYSALFLPVGQQTDLHHDDTAAVNPRVATSDNQLAILLQAGTRSGLRSVGIILRVAPLSRA